MKKVIFLDCDGVINNATTYHDQYDGDHTSMYLIDDILLDRVKTIQEQTVADIVLSSSWRHSPEAIDTLKKKGLKIIDITPFVWDKRGYEVDKWLQSHPEYYDYVILDDIVFWFLPCQSSHIIHTDQIVGITEEDMKEAIDILNNSSERKLYNTWKKAGIECNLATIYLDSCGWMHGIITEGKTSLFDLFNVSELHTYYLNEQDGKTMIHNTPFDRPYNKTFIANSYFIFHDYDCEVSKIIIHNATD